MAYQTLYLKYRSQKFGELVGQDAIAQTLKNAVEQGRVAHAYLFSGVRGTGKTSTARILAKAINCLDRKGAEPCGVCANCVEIGTGAAVDLIEIDAASNRGIDEIRDLRERVKYLPAVLKVKVYIIDEAHMLTTEAFNALLKTLEEPPAHVVFVLATTEPHKIPLTVASRCQRFDFRRIETGAIAARLAMIVEQEAVKVDPESLALLARLARGSMRDGITLLDQLISQAGEELTVQKTHELLGLADPEALVRLLGYVVEGDGARTLGELQKFYDAGGDVRQLVRGLLSAIREAALLSVGYQDAESLGGAASAGLEKIGRAAGRNALLALWKGLMEMEPELRKGADARLLLEVTLLSNMSQPVPVAVAPAAASTDAVGAERMIEPAMAPEPAVLAPDARWDALKNRLPKPVASLLMDARLAAVRDGLVRVEFRYPAHAELMQRASNRDTLLAAVREVFGADARLELAAAEKPASSAAAAAPVRSTASIADDPLVKEAMNRFDATNVRVTPRGRG
ncbi:MAG TPA: DNA polymerase III subunit gamma/tau [Candidatus Dormibacteraeota bacterium]|nr:DNA polymerase III subunit gamma/tau [Candidatus Dormibacteraeota bacterium]